MEELTLEISYIVFFIFYARIFPQNFSKKSLIVFRSLLRPVDFYAFLVLMVYLNVFMYLVICRKSIIVNTTLAIFLHWLKFSQAQVRI